MNEITYQGKYAFVDGYKFTKDCKTGYYLGTKKSVESVGVYTIICGKSIMAKNLKTYKYTT